MEIKEEVKGVKNMKTTKKNWQLLLKTKHGNFEKAIIEDYGQDVIYSHVFDYKNFEMESTSLDISGEDDLTNEMIYRCAMCSEVTYINPEIEDKFKLSLFTTDIPNYLTTRAFEKIKKYTEVIEK